VGEKPSF